MKLLVKISILVLLSVGSLAAQDKIQVVTKTINQSFGLAATESLRIDAEKAKISIQGWDQDEVKLVLKLVAKHPDRAIAEGELSALRYHIATEGTEKIIKNYFRLTEGVTAIAGNLLAEYELWIPHNRHVTISNRYGNSTLSDWQATLAIATEFGEIHLERITGAISLDVAYGDVTTVRTRGSITGTTRKSNLDLYELDGTLSLESSYGKINVTTQDQLQKLTIDASRTEVTFATLDPMRYHYQLTTSADPIRVPVPGTWDNEQGFISRHSFATPDTTLPSVIIHTTFSPITVNFLHHETLRSHRP